MKRSRLQAACWALCACVFISNRWLSPHQPVYKPTLWPPCTHLKYNLWKYVTYRNGVKPLCPEAHPPGAPPRWASLLFPRHWATQAPRPRITPYLRAENQARSWGLGEEDLPGGKVGGLAPRLLLSPVGGSSLPLFLILHLLLSWLFRQLHRTCRTTFSGDVGGTSKDRQRRH